MTIGQTVLALDDLLTGPDAPAFIGEARRRAPSWLLDQLDAAIGEAHRGQEAMAAAGIGRRRAAPVRDLPAWVRLGLLDTLLRWGCGRATTCLHDPTVRRPEPVFAAAWKPGLIVCAQCAHLLRLPKGSAADRRCDGCGRVVEGIEFDDPIWPASVQASALSYMYGCCRDCRHEEPNEA